MKRTLVAILLAACVAGGCTKLSKKEPARGASADAGTNTLDGGAAAVPTLTDAELLKIFEMAVYCRPACPERDAFGAQRRAHPEQVAMVALQIMAQPGSQTGHGAGLVAVEIVSNWLGGKPDEAARQRASKALEQVLATGSENMRWAAFSMLGQYELPNAENIVLAEAEKPTISVDDLTSIGAVLGGLYDTLDPIQKWIDGDQPKHVTIGLSALRSFDAIDADTIWPEKRELAIAAGRSKYLTDVNGVQLAFFYGICLEENPSDPEVRAVVEALARHPNRDVASQMRMLLLHYTDWKKP